ncbi:hypothetical protein C8Q77DRAFT_639205 [Trametes polyzona]|nr:hypothetical protein C8Q77DRAFT_639205 [Trametes polyzona]
MLMSSWVHKPQAVAFQRRMSHSTALYPLPNPQPCSWPCKGLVRGILTKHLERSSSEPSLALCTFLLSPQLDVGLHLMYYRLYGMTLHQVYKYYRSYPSDSFGNKVLVGVLRPAQIIWADYKGFLGFHISVCTVLDPFCVLFTPLRA